MLLRRRPDEEVTKQRLPQQSQTSYKKGLHLERSHLRTDYYPNEIKKDNFCNFKMSALALSGPSFTKQVEKLFSDFFVALCSSPGSLLNSHVATRELSSGYWRIMIMGLFQAEITFLNNGDFYDDGI